MGQLCSYESHTKYKDNWPPISSHFCWDIQAIKHTQIYVVWQLAYSTELLVCINHSKKQYKQRGGENSSLLNSTHSSSPLLSLVSLCVFTLLCHHYTALQWAYIYIYIYTHKWEWRGINHGIDYVLHHVSSGRLGIPTCIWWDIVCHHFLTIFKFTVNMKL